MTVPTLESLAQKRVPSHSGFSLEYTRQENAVSEGAAVHLPPPMENPTPQPPADSHSPMPGRRFSKAGGDPFGSPALYPAVPRQDHRCQVRRRRHEVPRVTRLRGQGPGPALLRGPQPRRHPRRRPGDQRMACPPQHSAAVPQRPPRHRCRHDGDRGDGPRRKSQQVSGIPHQPRRRHRCRPLRQRRPPAHAETRGQFRAGVRG